MSKTFVLLRTHYLSFWILTKDNLLAPKARRPEGLDPEVVRRGVDE